MKKKLGRNTAVDEENYFLSQVYEDGIILNMNGTSILTSEQCFSSDLTEMLCCDFNPNMPKSYALFNYDFSLYMTNPLKTNK